MNVRFLTKWLGGSQKQKENSNRVVRLMVNEIGDKVVFPLQAVRGDGEAVFWPWTQRKTLSSPCHIHGREPFELADTEKPMGSYATTDSMSIRAVSVFYCECGLRIAFPSESSFSKQELKERFAQWNLAPRKSAVA
ncbi:MAG: hypothetical protein HYY60_01585 [Parcubacteria group bacterium]|nr:hypothetical protein [Parcubacteria group bacterium]